MNKDNAARYLPLVQALSDGKTIQRNVGIESKYWKDTDSCYFDGNPDDWRIKPEPREWEIKCFHDGAMCVNIGGLAAPRGETIRVREIID